MLLQMMVKVKVYMQTMIQFPGELPFSAPCSSLKQCSLYQLVSVVLQEMMAAAISLHPRIKAAQ